MRLELKIAASAALLRDGCVNVIGLEEIRTEIGSRWAKTRGSVYAHLESLLRQKLGSSDFFVQLDDTSFVVSMPSATNDESQVLCLRVAYELHTILFGACDTRHLRIARATRWQYDELVVSPFEGESLVQLAAKAGLPLPSNADPGLLAAEAKPASTPSAILRPDRSYQFTPMWDVQKEAITTYRCTSVAEAPLWEGRDQNAKFKADFAVLLSRVRYSTQALAEHLQAGRQFLLSIPISYDLMCSPIARMELAAFFRKLSADLRPYLLFEFSELPHGVPQSRLCELVGSLRPFARGVIAQVPRDFIGPSAYVGTGLSAIGLSAVQFSGAGNLARDVAKLSSAAQRLHMKTFVLDIPNVEALQTVCSLGVDIVAGASVGAPLDAPAPVRRFRASGVQRHHGLSHQVNV